MAYPVYFDRGSLGILRRLPRASMARGHPTWTTSRSHRRQTLHSGNCRNFNIRRPRDGPAIYFARGARHRGRGWNRFGLIRDPVEIDSTFETTLVRESGDRISIRFALCAVHRLGHRDTALVRNDRAFGDQRCRLSIYRAPPEIRSGGEPITLVTGKWL